MSTWLWIVATAPLWGIALFVTIAGIIMEDEQNTGTKDKA